MTINGADLTRRLRALGMTPNAFHKASGIDRQTIKRAGEDDPRVQASTWLAIESALDKLDESHGMDTPDIATGNDDLVEFNVKGNFGVNVVVKGPVSNIEKLEETVARLMDRMQQKPE